MTYQWLLFDADDTLFDFGKAELKALSATFQQFGHNHNGKTGAIYNRINTQIWQELERGEITPADLRTARFQRLFDAVGIEENPAAFGSEYLVQLGRCGDLLPGVEETLAWANGRFQLALITNGLSDVQRARLTSSQLDRYFGPVIISDEVGSAKPDSAIFDMTFAAMGQPDKQNVLIIGDSLTSDMRGGVNYGIDTCWFNPKGKPNKLNLPLTYEIQQLSELISLLQ